MKDKLYTILQKEADAKNSIYELNYDRPDPLMVAKRYQDETIALICALFAYGNAKAIVKFLDGLDFELLDKDESTIKKALYKKVYRFQNSDDIVAIFLALKRLKYDYSIEEIVKRGYLRDGNILDGLWELIDTLHSYSNYDSKGFRFLIGTTPKSIKSAAPMKRYMMYFRWMVREDNLDMGLWNSIDKRDLIIPLDTHTHKVALKLGLLKRKSYNMQSAIELTNQLKEYDEQDPVKYDFALYRIGQESRLEKILKELNQ